MHTFTVEADYVKGLDLNLSISGHTSKYNTLTDFISTCMH